ncbi:MAG: DUF1211 domain-containing protein [Nitrospira sp.]|nr:DUF1211 domain-containing protein [Nitrospira sp.]
MESSTLVDKHRLEALADGIYAIALTLLVLDLKLPPLEHASSAALTAALSTLVPKGLVWLLSFWIMAMFWLAQLRALRQFAALDRPALRIELLQLALVSLFPFSTALVGEHGDFVAPSFIYGAHLCLLALLSLLRLHRLSRHAHLQSPDFDAPAARAQRLRAAAIAACALVSTVLALFVPAWNMLAMLPLLLLPGRPRDHASQAATHRRPSGS